MANIPVEPRRRSATTLIVVLAVALVAALAIWYVTTQRPMGAAPASEAPAEAPAPGDAR